MAIRIEDQYPTRSTPADADYPEGSFKNDSTGTALDGTPLEKTWPNDIYGFLQALLDAAGITPSGSPDTAVASQYLAAMLLVARGPGMLKSKEVPLPTWDMNAVQTVSVAHGMGITKIKAVFVMIRDDVAGFRYDLNFDYPGGTIGQGVLWDTVNIILKRSDGGFFDSADFASTAFSRGHMIIWYID
jgi:hypothetical protein